MEGPWARSLSAASGNREVVSEAEGDGVREPALEVSPEGWEGELLPLFLGCHSHCRHANLSPIFSGLNCFDDFVINLPVCTSCLAPPIQ